MAMVDITDNSAEVSPALEQAKACAIEDELIYGTTDNTAFGRFFRRGDTMPG